MMGRPLLRMLLPLVLIGACFLVWFEKYLPGTEALRAQFGADFVLRVCLGIVCLFVLLLWGELLRQNALITSVLTSLKDFAKAARASADTSGKRLEAVRLLVSAMASADPKVSSSCRQHLTRLCGQDLGEDPAAWQRWLEQQEAAQQAPDG
jgi:hypothetical protein